jgi:hypothetical protein
MVLGALLQLCGNSSQAYRTAGKAPDSVLNRFFAIGRRFARVLFQFSLNISRKDATPGSTT